MALTLITFVAFTVLVAVISYVKTKGDDQTTADGYFLAGRGLPGFVIAGSLLLTNLSAWLSGVWFDMDLVGGAFKSAAHALPFVHAVEMEKALFLGDTALAASHLLPVALYCVYATAAAVLCFLRQMKRQ